jgi:hypothetical protein
VVGSITGNASSLDVEELTTVVHLLLGFQPIPKLMAWFSASRPIVFISAACNLLLAGMLFRR